MAGIAPQAQRLIDALTDLGLRHRSTKAGRRQFRVRTETIRRNEGGFRYNEYGDADASIYGAEAQALVAEHAAELAAATNGTVYVSENANGTLGYVFLSSQYAKGGRVHRSREGAAS